jgi:hypothetical protein
MKLSRWTVIIAWAQLVGGIVGLALLALIPIQQERLQLPEHLRVPPYWYLAAAVAFALSIVAGELLRRGHRLGRTASLAIQAAQVVRFSSRTFVYQFVTGIELVATVTPGGASLSPGIRAGFTAGPPLSAEPWAVGINLFALLAVILLLRSSSPSAAHSQTPRSNEELKPTAVPSSLVE